jgi:F-box-like
MTVRNPTDPVQSLPDDILLPIFSCLSFHEIIGIQRVSSIWLSYVLTEPRLHRHVSFLNSKHQISLRTIRTMISVTQGRISSFEFDTTTLRHLTPLAPMYPHLQRLVINLETGYMGTIFQIAFRKETSDLFYSLPNLRTAIFQHGLLLNNEVATLLSIAPNLEELECRSAWVMLHFLESLDHSVQWKLKRLSIEHYSERMKPAEELHEVVHAQVSQSSALLRFLPDLEELTLGVEYLQVMDLTSNPKIRYIDFTPKSSIVSFVQPPPSLRVCLHAPALCQKVDGRPIRWDSPPSFISLSITDESPYLTTALSNSFTSLVGFGIPSHRFGECAPGLTESSCHAVFDALSLCVNLRYLDLSDSGLDDISMAVLGFAISSMSLRYLCLARTQITSHGLLLFLTSAAGHVREINVAETKAEERFGATAELNGVRITCDSPKVFP